MQMMLQKFDAAGHEWALRHFDHTLGATVVKSYKPIREIVMITKEAGRV